MLVLIGPAKAGLDASLSTSGKQPLVLIPQQVLLHLPHRIARQLRHHKTLLGNLEVGQLRLKLGHDGIGIQFGTGLGDDHSNAHFAKVGVRHADQGAFGHAGHVVDVALDLCRIDVVAAADDEVFAAAYDVDVAALIDLAHVTGLEVAVFGELFRRLLGHAPVALEHVVALDLDAADLAHGQVFAVVALHAQAHARQGEADGATTAPILAFVSLFGAVG